MEDDDYSIVNSVLSHIGFARDAPVAFFVPVTPVVRQSRLPIPICKNYGELKKTAIDTLNMKYRTDSMYITPAFDKDGKLVRNRTALVIRLYVHKSTFKNIRYNIWQRYNILQTMINLYNDILCVFPATDYLRVEDAVFVHYVRTLKANLSPQYIIDAGIDEYALWSMILKVPCITSTR